MGKMDRPHIGIFGRRNNGKSSLINVLTGQETAIVSNVAGTTTDPVRKAMEIKGIGPVILIDTAGIDDVGELGGKRVQKTYKALKIVDLAILVITDNCFDESEEKLVKEFESLKLPFLIVHNKSDINTLKPELYKKLSDLSAVIEFSALYEKDISKLSALIKQKLPQTAYQRPTILGDLVNYGDIVILVTPIDDEAPEGRLILPQVQTIRDILDNDCVAVVLKERELESYLKTITVPPKLVVTDSQEFLKTAATVPKNIALTSFSILFARLKGDFTAYLQGTPRISDLKDGDKILILESCTHQVSCDDIGRMKIPRWLSNYCGKKLEYKIVSGLDDLPDIKEYALVVQCGGCVISKTQLINRLKPAIDNNIPVTNYGMTIAYIHGIYQRAIAPFGQLSEDEYL